MLVQSRGESIGWEDRRSPQAPSRRNLARLGSLPASMSGPAICQSAPSRPISRSRVPVSTERIGTVGGESGGAAAHGVRYDARPVQRMTAARANRGMRGFDFENMGLQRMSSI